MRKLYTVKERIYNPFGDGLISSTEYLMKKYEGNRDIFISFTQLDKIGVNVQSPYNTPIGIYTYPLHEVINEFVMNHRHYDVQRKIGSFVPFAGGSPWVWVVEVKRGRGNFIDDIGDSSEYTSYNYRSDLEWLVDKRREEVLKALKTYLGIHFMSEFNRECILNDLPTVSDITEIDEANRREILISLLDKTMGKAAFHNVPGGRFWNVTRLVAGESPAKWNKIFQDMGYIGVADRSGVGVIHDNEKTQAVFFSKKAFTVKEQIENYGYQYDPWSSRKNVTIEFEKQISKLVTGELVWRDELIEFIDDIGIHIRKYDKNGEEVKETLKSIFDMLEKRRYLNVIQENPLRDFINSMTTLLDKVKHKKVKNVLTLLMSRLKEVLYNEETVSSKTLRFIEISLLI